MNPPNLVRRAVVPLAAAACCLAGPAGAAVIFAENFNGTTPGFAGLGSTVASFVVGAGAVDVLGTINGSFNSCPGARRNNCVDLGGGSAPDGSLGTLTTARTFRLVAGRSYTLTLLLAGAVGGEASRVMPSDGITFGMEASLGSQSHVFSVEDGESFSLHGHTFTFAANEPRVALTLRALNLDPLNAERGAIVDNVTLSVVPEPASTGLMLAGMGAVYGMARRRRSADGSPPGATHTGEPGRHADARGDDCCHRPRRAGWPSGTSPNRTAPHWRGA